MKKKNVQEGLVDWKLYLSVTTETVIAFYLATFCLAMYLVHRPVNWVIPAIFLIALYLFVIFSCAKRVFQKLPFSAIMLIIPVAPLLALIMVISLIPVIQFLQ